MRSLPKAAFLAGALVFVVLTILPWIHGYPHWASLGALAILGGGYGYYFKRHPSQRSAKRWSIHVLGFLAGMVVAWCLVLQAGHWRYASAEANVARSGLRPAPTPDIAEDQSPRNGQVAMQRLEKNKAFMEAFGQVKGVKSDLRKLIRSALDAAAGRKLGLSDAVWALAKYRRQWQPALKALRQAQKAPLFLWNVPRYPVPGHADVPNMSETILHSPVMNAVRAACAEALWLDANGDRAGAERTLKQAQWLSDKVSSSQNIVGNTLAMDMDGIIDDAATPLFKKGFGRSLLAEQDIGDQEQATRQTLRADLLQDMLHMQVVAPEHRFANFICKPWNDWFFAGELESNLVGLACADAPLMEAYQCMRCHSVAYASKLNLHGLVLWSLWEGEPWSELGRLWLRVGAAKARQELAYLSLKAGIFHKITHRWPNGFAGLPQLRELPDPFTGQPMITRLKNGRFELISVGSDGKEDGAKPGEGTDADIIVRL